MTGTQLNEEQDDAVTKSVQLATRHGFAFNCAKAGKGKTFMALGLGLRWWRRLEEGKRTLLPILVVMPIAVFEQNSGAFEQHTSEAIRIFRYSSALPDRQGKLARAIQASKERGHPLMVMATQSVVSADLKAQAEGRAASPLFAPLAGTDFFEKATKAALGKSRQSPSLDDLAALYRLAPPAFSGLIIDESQYIRNEATRLSLACKLLAAQVHREHGFTECLSGTPAVNKGVEDVASQMQVAQRLVIAHGANMQNKDVAEKCFQETQIVMCSAPNQGGYPDLEIRVCGMPAPSGMALGHLQHLLGEAQSLMGVINQGGKEANEARYELVAVLTRMRLIFASGAAAQAGYPGSSPEASEKCALCPLPRNEEDPNAPLSGLDGLGAKVRRVPREIVSICPCGHGRCSDCRCADGPTGCRACAHLEACRVENATKSVPEGCPQHWSRSAFYTEKNALLADKLRSLIIRGRGEELPDKALFVFSFRTSVECFKQFLRDVGLGRMLESCVAIDGSVSHRDRAEAQAQINAADSGKVACFMTPASGGVGLNLQGANQVYFFDVAWNCATVEQVVCRAWRLNQRRKVRVTYLITENGPAMPSLEEAMADLCRRKESAGNDLMRGQVSAKEALHDVAGSIIGGGAKAFVRREDGSLCRIRHGTYFQPEPIRAAAAEARVSTPPPVKRAIQKPPSRGGGGKPHRLWAKLEAMRKGRNKMSRMR